MIFIYDNPCHLCLLWLPCMHTIVCVADSLTNRAKVSGLGLRRTVDFCSAKLMSDGEIGGTENGFFISWSECAVD